MTEKKRVVKSIELFSGDKQKFSTDRGWFLKATTAIDGTLIFVTAGKNSKGIMVMNGYVYKGNYLVRFEGVEVVNEHAKMGEEEALGMEVGALLE